jgi:phage terminase large subunit-like protein
VATKVVSSSTVEPPFPRKALKELERKLGRSLRGWEAKAPAFVSPPPGEGVKGAWFDVDAVVRVVEQLRAMPHTSGRWRGTAFEPAQWQIVWIIAPVFGWKNADGLRIVSELWDEIARKNGKTTLSSRLGLVLLAGDGEYGAEVYAAAGSRDQAGFMFTPAKSVAEQSPALRSRLEVLTGIIRAPRTGGIFRVLSKAGDLAHGANVHGGLIDEIHVHKDRGLIDAIDSGTGAREQPLIIYTTTANDGDEQTIYGELHNRALALATRQAKDPSAYIVIWCASEKDNPFAIETIKKANPNYPLSPSKSYIDRKVKKAQDTPTFLPTYKRLHLNIRAGLGEQAWDGAEDWPNGAGMVVIKKLKATPVWVGLVCAATTDLSSIALLHENPEGSGWWCHWRWFLPADSLASLDRRTDGHASVWTKDGRLELTEGNVIDVARHTAVIREIAKDFDLRELVYDPNGAVGVISPLVEDFEDRLEPVFATNPASALLDWERLLKSGEFNHGGDPIAGWQLHHLRVKESMTKVIKIDRKHSTDNVFGIAAAELALRRALIAEEPVGSAYSDHDAIIV